MKFGLSRSCLEEMDLSSNHIGDVSAKFLGQALTGNCNLKKLNLTSTKLTCRGAFPILNAVQRFNRLTELTLDKNQLDGNKLRILSQMIIQNKGL